jgi:hypothetical protein
MTKEGKQWMILNSIFLIVFNLLFFVVGGFGHPASGWISYVFIHFAYSMLLLTPRWIRSGKSEAVFGFSLYLISATYFLVELFIGSIFILVAPEDFKVAFAVQLCLAGLFGIMLVLHMIANEWTADAEEKRQPQIAYIKNASLTVKGLLDRINDKEAKRKVERVYDALYSSPVKSHPELEEVEYHIQSVIRALEDAVSSGNNDSMMSLADSLETTIDERNRRLRIYN